MAINSLESYLFEKGIVGVLLVDVLKNARLGIDVEHYVSRLLNLKKEVFLDAVGGFPSSLGLHIQSNLRTFKELNITPVFVFKGLKTNAQFQLAQGGLGGAAQRVHSSSWETYYARYDKPVAGNSGFDMGVSNLSFKVSSSVKSGGGDFDTTEYFHDLIEYFHSLGLEYVVSPYLSWAQLSYLYGQGFVDVIYGPTECLLSNDIDKFIIGMELQSREFRFLDKKNFLSDFKITHKQLTEIATAVGYDLQPFPLTHNFGSFPDQIDFKWLHEFVLNGNSVYGVILNNAKKSKIQTSLDQFKDGISSLQFTPILKTSGRVELLQEPDGGFPEPASTSGPALASVEKIPNDIHEFIGQRLPHEYYFYQSIGLINPKLLETVAFGSYLELPPLDGGKSTQYKSLVNSRTNLYLKNQSLNLLTSSMPRYFQVKKINFVKYFDPKANLQFDFRTLKPLFLKLAHYLVKHTDGTDFAFPQLLTKLSEDQFLSAVDSDSGLLEKDEDKLQTTNDVLATSVTRLFYLYDFISLDNNKLTKWGQVLVKIGEITSSKKEAESLLLLLIFFKNHSSQDTLKQPDYIPLYGPFTPNIPGEINLEPHTQALSVITRLSLFYEISSPQSSINSSNLNKLNLNLLAFRSVFQFLKTQFNEVNQTILISLLCNNQFDRKVFKTNKQWKDMVNQVPLKNNLPSTVAAIVTSVYFEYLLREHKEGDKQLVAKAREFISKTYSHNINGVLKKLDENFDFLKKTFQLIDIIGEAKLISEDYFAVLKKAKQFLLANI